MTRHLLTIGGGLAGIALTVALLVTGASVIQGRQSADTPGFALETPDLADVPDLGGDAAGTEDGGALVCLAAASCGASLDPSGAIVRRRRVVAWPPWDP